MKIELLTDYYSNSQGFKLSGKGVHDVTPERARYLLNTFPDWFQAVDQAPVDESEQEQTVEESETSELDVKVYTEEGQGPAAEPDQDEQVDEGVTDSPTDTAETQDESEAVQTESETVAPTKSLSKMNKSELQSAGEKLGLELTEDTTADQMREAIKAAQETA